VSVNTRNLAAVALAEVVGGGRSLTAALEKHLPEVADPRERAFVQALCYGVVRDYPRLRFLLDRLARKPIHDLEIHMLALIGLHQLRAMQVKAHAAVSETVGAARRKPWAKPLLNAVLRNYLRHDRELEASAERSEEAGTAHPQWLIERLRCDWPEHWQRLLRENNLHPPMTLRVHAGRCDRESYLDLLGAAGLPAEMCPHSPVGITLAAPVAVDALPRFAQGWVSVQDEAAQLAALLLDAYPRQRVLDVCAAPGGKTAHLLETCPGPLDLVAVDVDGERIQRLRENLARQGLHATLVTGDARSPRDWWDGRPFDRILLDAPCSATGVIRRHPDIKLLRQPCDIDAVVALQRAILEAVWPLLKTGGILLYATCSVLRSENEDQIARFLQDYADAEEIPIEAEWGIPVAHGRQILPGESRMDGFYYARLRKRA
jgi:16S rRNA (cytosine967-C5)-methyltransferase